MMRTYSIPAAYECDITHGDALPDAELLIHFTFIPGQEPTGPSYASGGEPGYSAEAEADRVERCVDGKWIAAPEFLGWAQEYLDNAGYDAACEEVAWGSFPDPDDARDRRIDDALDAR